MSMVTVRVDDKLKKEASKIYKDLGLENWPDLWGGACHDDWICRGRICVF